ncbi:hypothetical protein DIPPA_64933 [Diplonema papillatum]|nr:hypothetical protein DIPPA_64933 [Diplonema papillatum]
MSAKRCQLKLLAVSIEPIVSGSRQSLIRAKDGTTPLEERELLIGSALAQVREGRGLLLQHDALNDFPELEQVADELEFTKLHVVRQRATYDAAMARQQLAELEREDANATQSNNVCGVEDVASLPSECFDASLREEEKSLLEVPEKADDSASSDYEQRLDTLTQLLRMSEKQVAALEKEKTHMTSCFAEMAAAAEKSVIEAYKSSEEHKAKLSAAYEAGRATEKESLANEYKAWLDRCREVEAHYTELYEGRVRGSLLRAVAT